MDINKIQQDVSEWAYKVFQEATLSSIFNHIRSELEEIEKEPHDVSEWADVMILFIQAAYNENHSMTQIFKAVEDKFEINKKRKWGKPNELGYVEHI